MICQPFSVKIANHYCIPAPLSRIKIFRRFETKKGTGLDTRIGKKIIVHRHRRNPERFAEISLTRGATINENKFVRMFGYVKELSGFYLFDPKSASLF
jgi:hypothetical protein